MDGFTVLHFCTTDQGGGGAAACAYGIHRALLGAGMRSVLVVRDKRSGDDTVVEARPASLQARAFQRVVRKWRNVTGGAPTARYVFDFDETPPLDFRSLLPLPRGEVDILFLHWSNRLLTSRWIRRLYEHYRCPIVWFLADQAAMTGGCHYTFGCEGFRNACGHCPQVSPSGEGDLSRRTWQRKLRLLADLPITFVCGGDWVLGQLERSSLFGHRPTARVPGIFDQTLYRPRDRTEARRLLGLPTEGKILFFGACSLRDSRKGGAAFLEAQEILSRRGNAGNVLLLFAGDGFDELKGTGRLRFPCRSLGLVEPSRLALAYQAANVFVCTTAADVGPGMVIESVLCGTPVAAFSVGIAAEILVGGLSGEVVPPGRTDRLAEAVERILQWPDDDLRKARVADTARAGYSERAAVAAYRRLFLALKTGRALRRRRETVIEGSHVLFPVVEPV